MEDAFITYKKALKAQYEIVKEGDYANFLLNPTPGKIRDLALLKFEDVQKESDLKIFQNFMGFAYDATKVQKIKEEIDKFKPLVTFLKGQTELADYNGADMLAVILDFNPRPFKNYIKKNVIAEKSVENSIITPLVITEIEENIKPNNLNQTGKTNVTSKSITLISGIFAGVLAFGVFAYYNIANKSENNCMFWNQNKFESIDCNTMRQGIIHHNHIPFDQKILDNFKKIKVDSNSQFFDNRNQPLIWYGKNYNNQYEFFTHYGIHPETGKTLKPISNYIINKYIKNKNSKKAD